jgi:hypothetical protein
MKSPGARSQDSSSKGGADRTKPSGEIRRFPPREIQHGETEEVRGQLEFNAPRHQHEGAAATQRPAEQPQFKDHVVSGGPSLLSAATNNIIPGENKQGEVRKTQLRLQGFKGLVRWRENSVRPDGRENGIMIKACLDSPCDISPFGGAANEEAWPFTFRVDGCAALPKSSSENTRKSAPDPGVLFSKREQIGFGDFERYDFVQSNKRRGTRR